MNNTVVDVPRSADKNGFALHVSSVIQSKGPQRFCARREVLSYHSDKRKVGTKLTPARKLLFATGHFQHDYVVRQFMRNSEFGKYIYAKWTCEDYTEDKRSPDFGKHPVVLDTFGNVTKHNPTCTCGKIRETHNEIDLILPSMLLVGHPDMIIRLGDSPSTYKYYIYEFKTVDRSDISFDDIDFIFADHRLQVTFYYKIMKALKLNVSRRLRVVYIDRSNRKLFGGQPYKELECLPEADEFLAPFRDALSMVKQGIKTGRLPGRICKEIVSDRAKNCEMAVECFLRKLGNVTPPSQSKVHNRLRPVVTGKRSVRA